MNKFLMLAAITVTQMLGVAPVMASAPQAATEVQRQQQEINEVVDLAKEVIMGQKNFANQTMMSCLRAFGHKQFCDCLSHQLPVSQSFDSYIFFITTEKEDLNYKNLNTDDRQLIDNAAQARELCVKEMSIR